MCECCSVIDPMGIFPLHVQCFPSLDPKTNLTRIKDLLLPTYFRTYSFCLFIILFHVRNKVFNFFFLCEELSHTGVIVIVCEGFLQKCHIPNDRCFSVKYTETNIKCKSFYTVAYTTFNCKWLTQCLVQHSLCVGNLMTALKSRYISATKCTSSIV